jgi:hypothetical protein
MNLGDGSDDSELSDKEDEEDASDRHLAVPVLKLHFLCLFIEPLGTVIAGLRTGMS